MKRYQKLFNQLKIRKEGALVPFVILGDPTFSDSLRIINTLITSGADALELGIPFSDPLADEPIIKNANFRAFTSGITPLHCFKMLALIRKEHPTIPIGLLIYANIVYSNGINAFYSHCTEVGVDSVLLTDIPFHESKPFYHAAIQNNISPIFTCPPNADNKLLQEIASHSQGYIYMLSRINMDDCENYANRSLIKLINTLKKYNPTPILLQGYDISDPSQVRTALKLGASGIISGSAIINIIEKYSNNLSSMLERINKIVCELKSATYN